MSRFIFWVLAVSFAVLGSVSSHAKDDSSPGQPDCIRDETVSKALELPPTFFPQTQKHYNREDLRAYEEETEIKAGVNCLRAELQSLTEAVKAATKKEQPEPNPMLTKETQLRRIRDALNGIEVRIKPGPGITPAPIKLGALDAMSATLQEQNKILEEIRSSLSHGGAAAPPITVTSISYATAHVPTPKADTEPRDQIDPTRPVREHFAGTTKIELALASIPDPRVPRHRRQYDNAITAINQGMLRNGFVLDLFGFPWSKDLQSSIESNAVGSRSTKEKAGSTEESRYLVQDDRYGLMIFRRDVWRENVADDSKRASDDTRVEVRAIYLIPETATYGLQRAALRCALKNIDDQVVGVPAPQQVNSKPLDGTECSAKPQTESQAQSETKEASAGTGPNPTKVLLFGPTFSGSVDSIRETALELWQAKPVEKPFERVVERPAEKSHLNSLKTISASASVDSNERVNNALESKGILTYTTNAQKDNDKLKFVDRIREQIGVAPSKVAIVYESTTFGLEACRHVSSDPDPPALCTSAIGACQ